MKETYSLNFLKNLKYQMWYRHTLKTCVYGLNHASWTCHVHVKEKLLSLGAMPCWFEPALFYWDYGSSLHGLITIHVGDLCWGRGSQFERNFIHKFSETLKIFKESEIQFKYLGLNIKQYAECITMDQISYINALEPMSINKERLHQKVHHLKKN